jgi:3-hydroxybutyryl-CoA dehydrogenase
MKIAVHGSVQQLIEWSSRPLPAYATSTSYHHAQDFQQAEADVYVLLAEDPFLRNVLPSQGIRLVNSVVDTTEDLPEGVIRINAWPGFLDRTKIEYAAKNDQLQQAESLFELLQWPTIQAPDVPGLITPRVLATIINEAFFALESGVASEAEIDTAMKLGTNYPKGPFEWCEEIGIKNVEALLKKLAEEDDLYKPCQLLVQYFGDKCL